MSCQWYHLSQLLNTAVPVLLCCDSLVSVPSSVPPYGAAQQSLGPPWQTRGTESLWQQGHLCHCLQLFPRRPRSHGCAGLLLRASAALGSVAGQGEAPRGCCALQEALPGPRGSAIAFPTSSFVWPRSRAGLLGLGQGPSMGQRAWGNLCLVPGPVECKRFADPLLVSVAKPCPSQDTMHSNQESRLRASC